MWGSSEWTVGVPSFCSLSGEGEVWHPMCHTGTESKMEKKCPLSVVPLHASEGLQAKVGKAQSTCPHSSSLSDLWGWQAAQKPCSGTSRHCPTLDPALQNSEDLTTYSGGNLPLNSSQGL